MKHASQGNLASLHPFLYSPAADGRSVLAEIERSTAEKAREAASLREETLLRLADRLLSCASAMAIRFGLGGRLFTFGNGGSSTDALAVAQLFLQPPSGRSVAASSLAAEAAVVTALGNDVGFDVVFARQLAALAEPTDVALGLSTSGNSENVLRAFEEASRRGLLTIGFAGYDGGRMAETEAIDHLFVIHSPSVHRIQETQTTLYHALWELSQYALARQTRRDRVG
ncbi:MAG TPA: SIS domain-containing protein [Thermoanaerobaculia bacterium]|jgi:D-sedoheptulose 7-phosphate isomerase|nr:SIS domain-containing protein [Thermoanaerobaculia bacterium]